MSHQVMLRTLLIVVASGLTLSKAECHLETPVLSALTYKATVQTIGTLSLKVTCEGSDVANQYTLNLSAPTGAFEDTQGGFVFDATTSAGSRLKMRILNAAPALGGSVVQTTFSGSTALNFSVVIDSGQWQAVGKPSAVLNIDIHPVSSGAYTQ